MRLGYLLGMPVFLAAAESVPAFFILLSLILGSVVFISLLFTRLKQSLLVGYFLCGLALSNSGILGWAGADSGELIHALSEIGVILLLFTLGIEFSASEIKNLKRPALIGGSIQVSLSALVATLAAYYWGLDPNQAIVAGFAFALSSTAVSMKCFQDMGAPDSPPGRVALGIALFQDLAVIFFIVLLPVLLDEDEGGAGALVFALGKASIFCVAMITLSRYGVPQLLAAVANTRSRELFTVAVVALCVVVAVIAGLLGLSPALGAFVAGVVVSNSIYSHRILADVLPFKDLLLTLFFVSIGLLIDLQTLSEYWALILIGTIATIVAKGITAAIAAKVSGLRSGDWLLTAAALSSTGEFSIVLLNRAAELDAIDPVIEQILLACTAITMGLVPSLMKFSQPMAKKLHKMGLQSKSMKSRHDFGMPGKIDHIKDHVIICGYGPVGQKLHASLRRNNIRSVIIENNDQTVKRLLKSGTKCLFADARHRITWELAYIQRARAVAFTFPLKDVVISALPIVREICPSIVVIARAKFSSDAIELQRAGVNHILLDEEECGKAVVNTVMRCFSTEEDGTTT